MIKYLKIIALLFVVVFKTLSQENIAINLKQELKKETVDTSKVNVLNSYAWQFSGVNPDTAIILSKQAVEISKKANWEKGQAISLGNIGVFYGMKGDYYTAINFFSQSLSIHKQIMHKDGIAKQYSNLGLAYTIQGNSLKALDYYYKGLNVAEEIKDEARIATILGNIGIIYDNQKDYQKSLDYYNRAMKVNKKLLELASKQNNKEEINKNKNGIARHLSNIGLVYMNQKKHDDALKYYFDALKIKEEINVKHLIAVTLVNIGNCYQLQNRDDSALTYYNRALNIANEIGDKENIVLALSDIASIKLERGLYSEAESNLLKALAIAKEIGSISDEKQIEMLFTKLYDKQGKYHLAYEHYKKERLLSDSINNEANTKQQTQLEMQYVFDKKQTADSLMVAEERRINQIKFKQEQTQRYYLYAGLFVVLVFAGVMFNRFKVTSKQKKIIEIKELETREQKVIIEEKHKEITDSINYAERIQRSFLASKDLLDEHLKEYFVLFKPKDVVSGDFYWAATTNTNNNKQFMLCTADSTGHGVPGAIMSLLNITSLEKAIEYHTNPDEILNHTRETIINRLKKDGSEDGGKDGMDCSLLVFNFNNKTIKIAAANNPVWIVRNNEVIEIKPDKMPVGKHEKQDVPFSQKELRIEEGDVIYTLTDGYPDQFGGEKGKKFMSKNLRDLLVSNSSLPMAKQKEILESAFKKWKGDLEQIDDVTVIGVRV